MSKNREFVYDTFKGIHVQAPENKIPPEYSPATQNFWTRNNELRSRPVFRRILGNPGAPANTYLGDPVTGLTGFWDQSGGFHTVAWCPENNNGEMFQLNSSNVWQKLGFLTANTITSSILFNGGTGYAVNDTGTINAGNINATYKVLTIETGGIVSTYELTYGGSGYSVATNVPTIASTGSGTGFAVNILAIGPSQILYNSAPVQSRVFAGVLYFLNGSQFVGYWDGMANNGFVGEYSLLDTGITVSGGLRANFGGLYIGESNNSLLIANTVEVVSNQGVAAMRITNGGSGYAVNDTGYFVGGNNDATYQITEIYTGPGYALALIITAPGTGYSIADFVNTTATTGAGSGMQVSITNLTSTITSFPQRIRWSANGLPNVWDPSVNTSAGYNDFLDVPDSITGLMSMGSSVVYIFRTNGITEQVVNGSGPLPFTWNHLWGEQHGIGNVFPLSIDSYGSVGFFVDHENVYQLSVYAFEPVGGFARDAIFADLFNATGSPLGGICDQFSNGFVYLTYSLCIPMNGGTKVWVYSLEDKTWQPFFISGFTVTSKPFRTWID